MSDEDTIVLNISGTNFVIQKQTTFIFPDSLLHLLTSLDSEDPPPFGVWKKERQTYFVQRSPFLFDAIILPCYLTGKLHVPKWMCPENVLDELKFWRLDLSCACACCAEEKSSDASNESVADTLAVLSPINKREKYRIAVWNFLDKPSSSVGALIFSIVSFLLVLLSTGTLIAFSINDISSCTQDDNNTYVINNITTVDDYSANFFSKCEKKRILQILELICVVWFTSEMILRFLTCPKYVTFFKSPINIIDILATIPYYLEMILILEHPENFSSQTARSLFVFVQILRCFRVFRILKLARYFQALRILGRTFGAAKDELCMLILFVMVTVFIFSSILYQLEKDEPDSQFSSIPASCWWGIITLTTVGYGDVIPKTTGGKIVNSIACVTGLMTTAFPVSILVEHFTNAYKTKSKRMFVIPKFRRYQAPSINSRAYHTFTAGDFKNLAKYAIHLGQLRTKDV